MNIHDLYIYSVFYECVLCILTDIFILKIQYKISMIFLKKIVDIRDKVCYYNHAGGTPAQKIRRKKKLKKIKKRA